MSQLRTSQVAVSYEVPRWRPSWAVPEVPVPESDTHDLAIEYVRSLLVAHAERSGLDWKIARNLGIRWVPEEPRYGFDPDLCIIEPAPPADRTLTSLRTWEPGHRAPLLAIEVVSPGHPYKDYIDTPERCAACCIDELWVYDPLRAGPRINGGPFVLQIWRMNAARTFQRVYAGTGPAFSVAIGAWLHPTAGTRPAEAKLHVSDDQNGQSRWLTREEEAELMLTRAERALEAEQRARQEERRALEAEQRARQEERRALEAEQRAREEAERRLAELLRELNEKGPSGGSGNSQK